ncbi:MAG: 5-(carboxyamino)imidazole ribonucleotide synthase [Actinomycetota bacterium]
MKASQIAVNQSQKIQRVGVIGGGQLAWMMAPAAEALGVELLVQTPHTTDPAAVVAADTVLAAIDDAIATAKLAARCDVITFENEFINLEALRLLEQQGTIFRPRLSALAPLLDKYHQRCYLQDLGLPTPQFATIESELAADAIGDLVGKWSVNRKFPVVLKARRHGYDGQGTFIIKNEAELQSICAKLGPQPLLVEEFVPFERELAAIAARSVTGEVAIFPLVETQQENQVCRRAIVPADISLEVMTQIQAIAHQLLNSLQVVGVFGIELFLTSEGKIFVNEIAPRTHNSGHFTIDACETSQFEQHLRAVCQLPLGRTTLKCDWAIMVNLLGYEYAQSDYAAKRQQLAQIPGAHVHWYGKSESRPGRKLGHVTVVQEGKSQGDKRSEALALAHTLESIWYENQLG